MHGCRLAHCSSKYFLHSFIIIFTRRRLLHVVCTPHCQQATPTLGVNGTSLLPLLYFLPFHCSGYKILFRPQRALPRWLLLPFIAPLKPGRGTRYECITISFCFCGCKGTVWDAKEPLCFFVLEGRKDGRRCVSEYVWMVLKKEKGFLLVFAHWFWIFSISPCLCKLEFPPSSLDFISELWILLFCFMCATERDCASSFRLRARSWQTRSSRWKWGSGCEASDYSRGDSDTFLMTFTMPGRLDNFSLHTFFAVCVSVFLRLCLSLCLPVFLSLSVSLSLSICLSLSLSTFFLFFYFLFYS